MYCEEVTPEEINVVEELNHILFPNKFKEWLLRKDKVLPEETHIKFYDPQNGWYFGTNVAAILSFKYKTILNEETWTERLYNDYALTIPLLPKDFIPFAMDGGGWSFCFDCRHDAEDPPVILWIGENLPETAVTPVAENFTAFLKLIGAQ